MTYKTPEPKAEAPIAPTNARWSAPLHVVDYLQQVRNNTEFHCFNNLLSVCGFQDGLNILSSGRISKRADAMIRRERT